MDSAPNGAAASSIGSPGVPAVVLNLIYSFKQGGAETVLLGLVRRLAADPAARWRPVVCAWRAGGPLEAAFRASGAETHVLAQAVRPVARSPLAALDFARLLARHLAIARASRARLVHGHMIDGAFLAAVLGLLLRLPSVTSVYSNHLLPLSLPPGSFRRRLWQALASWTFRRSRRVIVLSAEMRDTLSSEFEVDAACIRICAPGVAPVTPKEDRSAARVRLSLPADALVLLFVARLVPNKNQAALIETVRLLADRGVACCLLLAGEGPDGDALARLAVARGVADRVRLLGRFPDLSALFAAADLFVTASETEGVSLAVLEAMSAGTPVVALANEGNRDTLRDGCGILVEGGGPTALAEAILAVQADPERRAAVAARAGARFRQSYGLDAAVAAISAVYDEVLSATGPVR